MRRPVDPESIDDYLTTGGYAGPRRPFGIGPGQVISEVNDSRLMGHSRTVFPTGVKWEGAAKQPATRYLVCNANESEPGTLKDRAILESDPFALIESMTIAGYVIVAERGYIYLRSAYPRAYRMLRKAITTACGRGFLGADFLGGRWSFELEIRCGAGAYICDDRDPQFDRRLSRRTALQAALLVRARPLRQADVANNVETLCNVSLIVQMGGAQYAKIGSSLLNAKLSNR